MKCEKPDFAGKTVVVTGAARGIGRAIAEGFAARGAALSICGRNKEAVEEAGIALAAAHGVEVDAVCCDLGDPKQALEYIKGVFEKFGDLDVLVNNAGVSPVFGPLKTSKEADFDEIMNVNLKAPYLLGREAARRMAKRGSGCIVNISSVTGISPGAGMGLYSVSKAALIMLTKVMAGEFGPHGVRVNSVAPGLVKTSLSRPLWITDQTLEKSVSGAAIKRPAEPREVADAVIFLASDAAGYITGQILPVDGGGLL